MKQRLLCWLGFHPEIRCTHTPLDLDLRHEAVDGHCVACRREFHWEHYEWSPLGSYRKAHRDALARREAVNG